MAATVPPLSQSAQNAIENQLDKPKFIPNTVLYTGSLSAFGQVDSFQVDATLVVCEHQAPSKALLSSFIGTIAAFNECGFEDIVDIQHPQRLSL